MRHRIMQIDSLALIVSALAFLGLRPIAALGTDQAWFPSRSVVVSPAFNPGSPGATKAWSRTLEPVVLSGDDLSAFLGAPISDLFAFAFSGGEWISVPLQIDEVDSGGTYAPGDGLLDTNDEAVFMARDLGARATLGDWIDDRDSVLYSRVEVEVTNPLPPGEVGWLYVYRSATLTPPSQDYVSWDGGTNQIVAQTYEAGLVPTHFGIDSLRLNGSDVDALDRTKVRARAICVFQGMPVEIELNEDMMVDYFDIWDAVPDIDGPVRVGGGTVQANSWSYSSAFNSLLLLNLGGLVFDPCSSITVSSIRLSDDWLNPSDTGMAPATYYDANTPGGALVDGNPDGIATTPANTWRQVTGGQGSVVVTQDLSLGGGSTSNYYKDDGTTANNDTGDKRSYGDAGLVANNPEGEVRFESTTYVLGPEQPNTGATYRSYSDNPLSAEASAQQPCKPSYVWFGTSPFPVLEGSETTLTAHMVAGDPPFTYEWEFSDDNSTATGDPVTHTFASAGVYPVTLTVSNACGSDAHVHSVYVYVPGQAHVVYLPGVLGNAP